MLGFDVNIDEMNSAICYDKSSINLHANDILEIISCSFYIVYVVALFIFPFVMRAGRWSLLSISLMMLLANIVVYIILNVIDLYRPYKKYHIEIDNVAGIGCLGKVAIFVPVLLMSDAVSEIMINKTEFLSFLELPSYHDEWYITLVIWVVWLCSNLILTETIVDPNKLRLKCFMTPKEKAFELQEKERICIRGDINNKRANQKVILNEMEYNELPF